ncbi:MAG: ABC transporter ATP-binding protein [Planctomycetota bacterium]
MIRFEQVVVELAGRTVLNGVSLQVALGEAMAIIGRSSSGKSTLLAALATAVPISGGDITVMGHSIRHSPAVCRSFIGYVPSHLTAWPGVRADEFLTLFAAESGLSGKPLRLAIDKAIGRTGLNGSERLDTLSAGFAKRLLIARAMLHEPRVLVCDDPFNNSDPVESAEVERLIVDLLLADRIVVAAIDNAIVPSCFTHLAVLDEGRLISHGPAVPEAFSAGRSWMHRITCSAQAEAAADVLASLVAGVHAIDSQTIACRIDPAQVPCSTVIEALVRSGIPVESVGMHPHWTAQLIPAKKN